MGIEVPPGGEQAKELVPLGNAARPVKYAPRWTNDSRVNHRRFRLDAGYTHGLVDVLASCWSLTVPPMAVLVGSHRPWLLVQIVRP